MRRWVYFFGQGRADGNGSMKNLLGGKGAGLAEMTSLGLPVPPGFTISTEACLHWLEHKHRPVYLEEEVEAAIADLERIMERGFGDPENPLLVSVRSGGRVSMPGMMDSVLNLGLNEETARGLAKSGGERFAWDAYRRFVQMYSNVVLGMNSHRFEEILDAAKRERGVTLDTELDAEDLQTITRSFLALVRSELGRDFPTDPKEQLWTAITAVFASWNNARAVAYRNMEGIDHTWGTAVNVQSMVYGNMGDDCATGVAFTRDPSTGDRGFFGEYLINAQGEDVVAGTRTPQPLRGSDPTSLESVMPEMYAELDALRLRLERHYKDMQDLEFTIERNTLYMLQTRTGKRSASAAVHIAVDMVREGLIDKNTALLRVTPEQIENLLHPRLDPTLVKTIEASGKIFVKGLNAGPGAAVGELVFNADAAEVAARKGRNVVLMRPETSPEDIKGMAAAVGIVTARGGATSHAAVVARGMGKPCVAGCSALHIDEKAGEARVGDAVLRAGDVVTIEGSLGWVITGEAKLVEPEFEGRINTLMGWADAVRRLGVRANADTPHDAGVARDFGAQGIGLCRTEHMFFQEERLVAMREMILANSEADRRHALKKLLPMQRDDFMGIFRAMKGLPVTIRLLDPPLHEFLPSSHDELEPIAKATGLTIEALERRVHELEESNPMLGHRGCRLGITFPEILEMQTEAIISAACRLVKNEGFRIVPEVMIPLVGLAKELEILREKVDTTAHRVVHEEGVPLHYKVGTMIELPRAAITADEVARHADFFSFGTNDLTQTTFGLSRDDAGKFLQEYIDAGILTGDPFASIDHAVGELVKMGTEKGRRTRPALKVGICGEHGGDPRSIIFCHNVGLDYVSCSPFRVPVARMAAARAALLTSSEVAG